MEIKGKAILPGALSFLRSWMAPLTSSNVMLFSNESVSCSDIHGICKEEKNRPYRSTVTSPRDVYNSWSKCKNLINFLRLCSQFIFYHPK